MHDYFTITGNSCRIPFADLCRRDVRYQSYFTKKEYQGSQCIHPQGTKINHFGIVVSGILKAVDNTLDGTEMCHAYFEPKDIFPEFLYFSGERYYTYSLYGEEIHGDLGAGLRDGGDALQGPAADVRAAALHIPAGAEKPAVSPLPQLPDHPGTGGLLNCGNEQFDPQRGGSHALFPGCAG